MQIARCHLVDTIECNGVNPECDPDTTSEAVGKTSNPLRPSLSTLLYKVKCLGTLVWGLGTQRRYSGKVSPHDSLVENPPLLL